MPVSVARGSKLVPLEQNRCPKAGPRLSSTFETLEPSPLWGARVGRLVPSARRSVPMRRCLRGPGSATCDVASSAAGRAGAPWLVPGAPSQPSSWEIWSLRLVQRLTEHCAVAPWLVRLAGALVPSPRRSGRCGLAGCARSTPIGPWRRRRQAGRGGSARAVEPSFGPALPWRGRRASLRCCCPADPVRRLWLVPMTPPSSPLRLW
jgi:hypothetical protein